MGIETVAIVAGLAISAAASGYGVSQQRDAARDAKDAARDQEAKQRKLEEEAANKEQQDRMIASGRTKDARDRLQLLQGGKSDRSGTIRTTALGTTADQGNYARKAATGL